MGTNYYLHKKVDICPTCGRSDPFEPLHIGKSSAGWCFSLRVYPDADDIEEGLPKNLEDWKALWSLPNYTIFDEYRREVSPDEMLEKITKRTWGESNRDEHFYRNNHAIEGPNGLLRHKLEPGHCIGHGDGTYDLIAREFS